MERSISAMVGKGSIRHNSRQFIASNVDKERTPFNVVLCNEKIEKTYHKLFDEALKEYNDKQKRADRKIDNYYKKIRTGKQEKPFHEVILQIGNKDDTASNSAEGMIAKEILEEYYKEFVERNKNLEVFSAHIHMDEATPHIHIDFVPFTENSSRGLSKRVSLKQALSDMGFVGENKFNTEWKIWIESEKTHLTQIMQAHGMERKELGQHKEHLSVLDFKKEMRLKEIEELDNRKDILMQHNKEIEERITEKKEEIEKISEQISDMSSEKEEIEKILKEAHTDTKLWTVPPPTTKFGVKKYYEEVVKPAFERIKNTVQTLVHKVNELSKQLKNALRANERLNADYKDLMNAYSYYEIKSQAFDDVCDELGQDKVKHILEDHQEREKYYDHLGQKYKSSHHLDM